jgi:polyferredoxin
MSQNKTALSARIAGWRMLVQWSFLAWCLFLGVQFSLFVGHYQTGAAGPGYLRPPGVEGFLPIGALMSCKAWLLSGEVDPVHPAALVIFASILLMSLLAKKSFCSWLCPVGTLSELLWKTGRKLFGRTFRPWRRLDLALRGLKYLLLLLFVKLIWIDMPLSAIQGFFRSPYWAVSDIRMLQFFTGLSLLAFAILAGLILLSLLVQNAWCRYLCPYGALLGLLSIFSPLKINRNQTVCSGCGNCSRHCPAQLPVAEKTIIRSAECTACLTCVDSCPEPGALQMALFMRVRIPRPVFALLALALFACGIGFGMLEGHWHTNLADADFQHLVPLAAKIGH